MSRVLVVWVLVLVAAQTLGACICAPGRVTCDRACVDVETDTANCGACGEACGLGQQCVAGACTGAIGLACTTASGCDDGRYCNGPELCIEGVCRAGITVVCDDGVTCTAEVCSETLDACVASAVHTRCPSATLCTGSAQSETGCE